jgi:hypothetical protein
MKIYVKKDKVLKLLGEGKVYSKKDLVLKEGDASSSGFLKNSSNIATAAHDSERIMNANPTLDNVNASADDATSGERMGNTSDPSVDVNVKDPNSIKMTQQMMNGLSPQQKSNIDLNFYNGDKVANGVQLAHKTPKKVMDEMRENSIPFTKAELTDFLRSL